MRASVRGDPEIISREIVCSLLEPASLQTDIGEVSDRCSDDATDPKVVETAFVEFSVRPCFDAGVLARKLTEKIRLLNLGCRDAHARITDDVLWRATRRADNRQD